MAGAPAAAPEAEVAVAAEEEAGAPADRVVPAGPVAGVAQEAPEESALATVAAEVGAARGPLPAIVPPYPAPSASAG